MPTAGSETLEDEGNEVLEGESVASVSIEEAGWLARVSVLVDEAGRVVLHSEAEWPTGGSGGEASLAGLDVNDAFVEVHEDLGGRVMVFGLIGPSVTGIEVRVAGSGATTTGSGPSWVSIEGSDHVLFVALLDPEWANRDLVVVGTTVNGEEIVVPYPN
jgi:hypothetical protein